MLSKRLTLGYCLTNIDEQNNISNKNIKKGSKILKKN